VKAKMQVGKDVKKVVHERVLLLPNSSEKKSQFLSTLGDIYLKSHYSSQLVDDLDQADSMYQAAMQLCTEEGDPIKVTCLTNLGTSMLH
jgi:hypothetical protein